MDDVYLRSRFVERDTIQSKFTEHTVSVYHIISQGNHKIIIQNQYCVLIYYLKNMFGWIKIITRGTKY